MDQEIEIAVHTLRTMHITVIISAPLDRAERTDQCAADIMENDFQLAVDAGRFKRFIAVEFTHFDTFKEIEIEIIIKQISNTPRNSGTTINNDVSPLGTS